MSPKFFRRRPLPRFVRIGGLVIFGFVAAFAIEDRAARPSLTGFDPARMAHLEASMWRSYYEHRWFTLAMDGMKVSCGEYGFSWWDGMRTSQLAARAALHFRGDTDDPRCLPLLERYYAIIRHSTGGDFDTAEAARLELEWWRERRRKLGPADYGKTIAANIAMVYGLEPAELLPASRKRAEAMDYRDRHGRRGTMTEEDWAEVARQLEAAYSELKAAARTSGATGFLENGVAARRRSSLLPGLGIDRL